MLGESQVGFRGIGAFLFLLESEWENLNGTFHKQKAGMGVTHSYFYSRVQLPLAKHALNGIQHEKESKSDTMHGPRKPRIRLTKNKTSTPTIKFS